MDKILDMISKVTLPKVIFTSVEETEEAILFASGTTFQGLSGDDELTLAVNSAMREAMRTTVLDGKATVTINNDQVLNNIHRWVINFHSLLWMGVNKKVNWRRTKMSKDLSFANSQKFKDQILELYLDAVKHGITKNSVSHKGFKIEPIHKFIAIKFQTMVEAECPR